MYKTWILMNSGGKAQIIICQGVSIATNWCLVLQRGLLMIGPKIWKHNFAKSNLEICEKLQIIICRSISMAAICLAKYKGCSFIHCLELGEFRRKSANHYLHRGLLMIGPKIWKHNFAKSNLEICEKLQIIICQNISMAAICSAKYII